MSKAHELAEGQLATLGNTLVLLDLIGHRIDVAIQRSTASNILTPAIADLDRAIDLIRCVQHQLSDGLHSSSATHEMSNCSSGKTHKVHQNPIAVGLGRDHCQKTTRGTGSS